MELDKFIEKYNIETDSKNKIENLYNHHELFTPVNDVELYFIAHYFGKYKLDHLYEKYLLRACENGLSEAFNALGTHYNNTKKYDKMEEYFLKAIELNNVDAMINLARFYSFKDNDKMIQYYEMAVDLKSLDAMCILAEYYESSRSTIDLAMKYYEMAIELGDVDSMYKLGILNNINEELKIKYLTMAADHDNIRARNKLIEYYNYHKKFVNVLDIYIKYKIDDRDTIIKKFNEIGKLILSQEEQELFLTHLTTFEFKEEDKLSTSLKCLINSLNTKLELMDLHFNYSMQGLGYQEAKSDFFKLL